MTWWPRRRRELTFFSRRPTRLRLEKSPGPVSALRYGVHTLPAEIEGALLAMVQAYGLKYAAIDLLYTRERRYIFLELNAVGQLGWLEEPTGLPLFASLAQFLAGVS